MVPSGDLIIHVSIIVQNGIIITTDIKLSQSPFTLRLCLAIDSRLLINEKKTPTVHAVDLEVEMEVDYKELEDQNSDDEMDTT